MNWCTMSARVQCWCILATGQKKQRAEGRVRQFQDSSHAPPAKMPVAVVDPKPDDATGVVCGSVPPAELGTGDAAAQLGGLAGGSC